MYLFLNIHSSVTRRSPLTARAPIYLHTRTGLVHVNSPTHIGCTHEGLQQLGERIELTYRAREEGSSNKLPGRANALEREETLGGKFRELRGPLAIPSPDIYALPFFRGPTIDATFVCWSIALSKLHACASTRFIFFRLVGAVINELV